MLVAAVQHQCTLAIVEVEIASELGRRGLTQVPSVPLGLFVGEKVNGHGLATRGCVPPIIGSMGGMMRSEPALAISARPTEGGRCSTDNVVAAFLTLLAGEPVTARTARLYLGHLSRFGAWLSTRYGAPLLQATSHDLREYRAALAAGQKPASVNAALAVLRRFYTWALSSGRMKADPTARVKPLASQPLAPRGFTPVERQRLRREAERAGPMADAIVTTLLDPGLRVDELVRLTWEDVVVRERSGQADIQGKGGEAGPSR